MPSLALQSATIILLLLFFFCSRTSSTFQLVDWREQRTKGTCTPPRLPGAGSAADPNDDVQLSSTRDQLAQELLQFATEVGQVGKKTTEENRRKMDDLSQKLSVYSDPHPARIPLEDTHTLVYSASEAGPPAGLVGPFVGKVTQIFWNETVYENVVKLGPLRVSIFANREVTGDDTISVSFYETQIRLFGKRIVRREVDLGEPGTWKQLFVGRVNVDGEGILLRVMNTPKLFILKQPLN